MGLFSVQQHVGGYARKTVVCPKRPGTMNSASAGYPVSITSCFALIYFIYLSAEQKTEFYIRLQWQPPAGCFIRRTRTQVIAGTFTLHRGSVPAYDVNSASINTGKASDACKFSLECHHSAW
jgi:hypothetical protein